MTDQDKVDLGMRAKCILENPDVMWFLGDELERIKTSSFNTQPDEGKLRSELYYRHHALTEYINSLADYRNAALALLEQKDD